MLRWLHRIFCIHNYRYIGYKFLRNVRETPIVEMVYRCNKCGHIKKIKVKGKLGGN